jgi:hypothetical protein
MKSLVLTIGLLAGMPAYSTDLPFESELAGLLQQQSKAIAEDTEQRMSQLVIAPLTAASTGFRQQPALAKALPNSPPFGKIDPALLQLAALTVADISGSY